MHFQVKIELHRYFPPPSLLMLAGLMAGEKQKNKQKKVRAAVGAVQRSVNQASLGAKRRNTSGTTVTSNLTIWKEKKQYLK